jgi:hypothetical protein
MLSGSSFRAQLVIHEQRELFDYWRAQAGERSMPRRQDIDPRQIVSLLPFVSLVELATGPDQAWYRLAGSKLREIYGFEVTGKRIADLGADRQASYWRGIYEELHATGRAMHGAVRGPSEGREHILMFWLRLPLSDGDGVNRVLCYDTSMPAVGEFGERNPCLVPPLAARAVRSRQAVRARACA